MGVTCAVTRVACNTSTGTQDITTTDLGGLTPKAAILIVSYGVTDGTAAADAVLSYGVATGSSNRWAFGGTDEDAQDTTDTTRSGRTDSCVYILSPGETTADGIADFSAWITDGIRVNWSDAPASAYLLTAILFAGSDLSAHANTVGAINQDATTNVEDPAFEPDLLINANIDWTSLSNNINTFVMNVGLVHNDRAAGITQRSKTFRSFNNAGTSDIRARCTSSAGLLNTTTGSENYKIEFSDFDSLGFSATARTAASKTFGYLALRFGSGPAVDSWVGTHSTPTSTGNDSETGPGFTPQLVMMLGSHMQAVDTAYTDSNAGTFGISAFDDDDEFCTSISVEDAQDTSDTQSLSDNTAVEVPDDAGTAGLTASFVSFDANGWTLNYSAVESNAKLFFALAIEEEAVGDLSVNVSDSVSVTDTPTLSGLAPGDLSISESDAVSVADSPTTGPVSDPGVSESEAITATDSPTMYLGVEVSESEAITVGDTATLDPVADTNISESETVTVADSPTMYLGVEISESDAITIVDTATLDPVTETNISESEAITVVDTASLTSDLGNISESESITVVDSPTVSVVDVTDLAVSESDAVTVVDTTTFAPVSETNILESDAVGVVDAATLDPVADTNISESDAVTVADTATVFMSVEVSESEAVTVSDNATLDPVTETNISESDAVSVTDTATLANDLAGIDESESVTIADTATIANALAGISESESITVGDVDTVTVIEAGALAISRSDSITVVDTPALVNELAGVSESDAVTVADAASFDVPVNISESDAVSATDTASLVNALAGISESDAVSVNDTPTLIMPVPGALSINLSDTVSVAEDVTMQNDLPGINVDPSNSFYLYTGVRVVS